MQRNQSNANLLFYAPMSSQIMSDRNYTLLQVHTAIYISIQTERNTYDGTSHEIVELLQKHNVIKSVDGKTNKNVCFNKCKGKMKVVLFAACITCNWIQRRRRRHSWFNCVWTWRTPATDSVLLAWHKLYHSEFFDHLDFVLWDLFILMHKFNEALHKLILFPDCF